MLICGINYSYDVNGKFINSGGSAIIKDGRILGAISEERIAREKHIGGFLKSTKLLLQYLKISVNDIDRFYVSFYSMPIIPDCKLVETIAQDLGLSDLSRIYFVNSHHSSHAYMSYFLSNFNEAIIVVADNEGSILHPIKSKEGLQNKLCFERNSYYWAKSNCMELIDRDFNKPKDFGWGKAYSRFTRYIGFGSYTNAGKLMGLSSYGNDNDEFKNLNLWDSDIDGSIKSNISNRQSLNDVFDFFYKSGVSIPKPVEKFNFENRDLINLSRFIQKQLENSVLTKIKHLVSTTGIENICIGGGVALNSLLNQKIERKLNVKVFCPPSPGDEGQALGNAILGYIKSCDHDRNPNQTRINFKNYLYLGKEYSDIEINKAVNKLKKHNWEIREFKNISKVTAYLIDKGLIIGWFQGKSEYGPRALGNRSILADPRDFNMLNKVNNVKGRELFRPLAPSILDMYFEDYYFNNESYLSESMSGVFLVKKKKEKIIPAVVHIDGGSRVQKVTQKINPLFYDLIEEFYKITKIPLVINTSFNSAGSPIVETPLDAVNDTFTMDLDALVISNKICVNPRIRVSL